MAVTLNDIAQVEQEPLRKGVLQNLLRFSDLLNVVPWETATSLSNIVTRWKVLPDVAWRKINEGYTESTGKLEQIIENLFIIGGDIDIDRKLLKATNVIENPEVTQINMMTKAIAYAFNDCLINGDPTVDEDQFTGLHVRLDNKVAAGLTRQLVYTDASGDGTGAALKVTLNTANRTAFLDFVEETMDYVEGGATHLLMNQKTRRVFSSVLRDEGLFNQSQDQFGRTITEFRGAEMIDVGLQADKATEIITETETECSDNVGTSIYAVRFEVGEGICGVHDAPPDAYLVAEELETAPVKRYRIDWAVGLADWSDYSIARMCGFKMAAA